MMKKRLLERFLDYAGTDTMSNQQVAAQKHPSTEGQWVLLRKLERELREMGVEDVSLDNYGYLLARIPANTEKGGTVAFSAHVDTSSDVEGNGVRPQVIPSYDGKDIELKNNTVIRVAENPDLEKCKGQTLVTSDGTTLLGADDKSGLAEIMTAVQFLLENPQVKHPEIELLFSPDEETGFGMDFFDVSRLGCKALYTVDGGRKGEIEAECFNAGSVRVRVTGVPRHLGEARGKFVNAITVLSSLINALPQSESPEATDGYYGYYCVHVISGNTAKAEAEILVRDFDYDCLKRRIAVIENLARVQEQVYEGAEIEVEPVISYLNMKKYSEEQPKALEAVFRAGEALGQPLELKAIRGGTDGARIADMMHIPCPNIYSGAHNMHSYTEWVSLDTMYDAFNLILGIAEQWVN